MGCDSGRVHELESQVSSRDERIAELEGKLGEAQDHLETVKSDFEDLQSAVDSFNDPDFKWWDIVPDVESKMSELEGSLDELESELSEY